MSPVNPIQVQKYLNNVDYPASKQDLMKTAEREGADDDIRSTLERLPDETYDSPVDVSQAIGKLE